MGKNDTYFCKIEMVQKQKTPFFVDVRMPIKAGMEMLNGKAIGYKIKTIGYEYSRVYFDSDQKDRTIGIEQRKRVIKHH